MAGIQTYADLKTEIGSFLRNRSDIVAQIPFFVQFCEAQLNRRLRTREMVTSVTFSIDAEFVDLPAGYLGVRTFYVPGSPPVKLDSCDPDTLAEWKAGSADLNGKPHRYAVVGNQFQFSRIPDQPYPAQLVYWQRLTPLVMDADTNWMLANNPDAYLYGSLLQSAPWLGADDRIQTWGSIAQQLVSDIAASSKIENLGASMATGRRYTP